MKVALVSTYRTHCGIAFNTEYIANELTKLTDVKIFAENIFPPFTENPPIDESIKLDYERCWERGKSFELLEEKIKEYSPNIVHFNFTPGLYDPSCDLNSHFQKFISNLRNKRIKTVFTLQDILNYSYFPGFQQLSTWFKNLQSTFIVMNSDMSETLKKWYPEADVSIIYHGSPEFQYTSMNDARQNLNLKSSDFILSTFGFYGPNKGMLNIINAIPNINIPNFKVAFIGGFPPLSTYIHKSYIQDCIKQSIKLGVTDKIIFLNKLVLAKDIGLWCAATNFIISLQEEIQSIYVHVESSSVHLGLSSSKPIIMENNPRFSTFTDGKDCIKISEDKIAETLNNLYKDKLLQNVISAGAHNYSNQTTFKIIAQKYMELYEKCLKN